MKICVYAISKNEVQFVKRFCDSARDADLILIADTGSTDGLPEEAAKHGATVYHIGISPWRFDLARNAALALVPTDVDVCISLDIDEVLMPGWREEIERVWVPGVTTHMRYFFDYGSDIKFYAEKIHSRHGYKWHHPCHEVLRLSGDIQEVWAHSDMLLALHMPDPSKSRGHYFNLLELAVKEDPSCHRNAFYYARELSFYNRWEESIDGCKKYLAMPGATWGHERCYAYRVIGRSYKSLNNNAEAEKAFHMAAAEVPHTREPWYELANLMYLQSRWEECFAYAIRGLQVTVRENVYTVDPTAWGYILHDLAAISAFHLGVPEIAIKHGQIALDLEPDDGRLQNNLQFYQGATTAKTDLAAE
jgi:glycosyltransferase involved in cell wall biosynthesis